MRVQVQKWGNSLALRIPKPFAEDTGVREGSVVQLTVAEGRLVAEPLRKKKVLLRQLLAGINRRNIHKEMETGPAVGREIW